MDTFNPVELGVAGAVDLIHPALADLGGYFVRSNSGIIVERHRLSRYVAAVNLDQTAQVDIICSFALSSLFNFLR